MGILQRIASPADLRKLSIDQLPEVAADIREAISRQVAKTGGHLAPNLGLTLPGTACCLTWATSATRTSS
jgi:1-deoxy-D-xylulose-5-phosphate synthase